MLLLTLDPKNWKNYAPYVDTFCFPLYANPFSDSRQDLDKLREIEQIAHQVEKRVTGRLLLLPAVCYSDDNPSIFQSYLTQVMDSFFQSGFRYGVTISVKPLSILDKPGYEHIHFRIDSDPLSPEQIGEAAEECFQQILRLWVKNT